MNPTIKIRRLGLAAYAKIKTECKFIGHEDGYFIFESSLTYKDLETQYLNSECHEHDMQLMTLRNTYMRRKDG